MSKVSKFLKKNQIAICAGLGIFGTVAAVGTSIPATIKAVRVIDKATADKGSELTFGEKVKLVWKFYVATVLATAGSVTANAIGGVKAVKQISSLATTVSSLAAAHEVYKEDIRKALGKEKYEEVRKQIAEEKTKNVADDGLPFDLNRHDGKLPCKDLQTGKWFWTTYEQLVDAK